jgi:hypothetical protein
MYVAAELSLDRKLRWYRGSSALCKLQGAFDLETDNILRRNPE